MNGAIFLTVIVLALSSHHTISLRLLSHLAALLVARTAGRRTSSRHSRSSSASRGQKKIMGERRQSLSFPEVRKKHSLAS
ncbi:hypothetical protein VNO80_19010 [Phaseolus coccineus]|uniref:Secreted protein n=1 Tax=Phaseolus coccineus TaxID=3886 RepID=A0AAN9MF71_PHACN